VASRRRRGPPTPSPRRSAVEDLRNEPGLLQAAAGDLFAWALATGDFNGDGVDDLAPGIPLDNGYYASEVVDAGRWRFATGRLGSGLRHRSPTTS